MGHLLKMKPVFHEKIWGGHKLKDVYGYDIPSDHTGEAWVISAHKNGDCVIDGGEFDGQHVSAVFENHRELFGNIKGPQFPLLVKILDANDDLSVQVHPDDSYAQKYENSLGKSESWFVLDCDQNTKMVMGHHAQTKEEFKEMIEKDEYEKLLHVIDIHKGDFFYIPAGTLHAICAGSLIYEAQQSSDVTYRVYDYHRKDNQGHERELHIQKSIDVTKIPGDISQNNVFVNTKLDNGMYTKYLQSPFLSVYGYKIFGECVVDHKEAFSLISIIDGTGFINDQAVKKGDHFIVCSDVNEITYNGNMDFMLTTL